MIHKLNFWKTGPECGQPLGPHDGVHEVPLDLSIAAGRNDAITCMDCLSYAEQEYWRARFTINWARINPAPTPAAIAVLVELTERLLEERLDAENLVHDLRTKLDEQAQDCATHHTVVS